MAKTGPDSKWSWVIAVACCWVTFVIQGLVRSGGVVYVALIDAYRKTSNLQSLQSRSAQQVPIPQSFNTDPCTDKAGIRMWNSLPPQTIIKPNYQNVGQV
ncbi:hypothetical protein TNCV_1843341 [Trichonephila clavipes]|nr:hypothetical protein TNCV_1843341 [Trichonephila clavipes]